jgi:hypothetical protein
MIKRRPAWDGAFARGLCRRRTLQHTLSLRGALATWQSVSPFGNPPMGTRIATPSFGWFAMTLKFGNPYVWKNFRYPHPSASRPPFPPQGRYLPWRKFLNFWVCRGAHRASGGTMLQQHKTNAKTQPGHGHDKSCPYAVIEKLHGNKFCRGATFPWGKVARRSRDE